MRGKCAVRIVFEPASAAHDVFQPIAIHIDAGQPFGDRRGRENLAIRPRLRVPWACGKRGQIQLERALVPENQFRFGVAVEGAHQQIVMLAFAGIFDDVAVPWNAWIEIRIWILPPPHMIVGIIRAGDDVQVAIAVHVRQRSTSLHRHQLVLHHVFRPFAFASPVPQNSGRGLARRDEEIVDAVFVQIAYHGAGLLRRWPRRRQFTLFA